MDTTSPYVVYHWDVVYKCFEDQELLMANLTCTIRANFHNAKFKKAIIMGLPNSLYASCVFFHYPSSVFFYRCHIVHPSSLLHLCITYFCPPLIYFKWYLISHSLLLLLL